MKVLHTSDWHVDLHAAQLGDVAPAVRAARWRAVSRLVTLAHDNAVDLVLVAGDTFDSVDSDDESVARVVELLNAFAPIPIVVLPGNHDPVIAGGVWERRAWSQLGDHVTLALAEEPIELALATAGSADPRPVMIFPCPVRQKRSRLDPTEWIPAREPDDRRLRIGLAHGSVDVHRKAENFPIAQDRVTVSGLDYLALGDWHGQRILGGGTTAYPGTPEATSFSEQRTGAAILVHLDDDRASGARLEQLGVGQFKWLQRKVDLRDATDLAELETEMLALGPAEHSLVRLEVRLLHSKQAMSVGDHRGERAQRLLQTSLLGGTQQDPAMEELSWVESVDAFRAKWAERLLYFDWCLTELEVGSEDLPGALSSVDAALRQALAGESEDPTLRDLVGVDAAILREARWQLRMMAAQASNGPRLVSGR